MVILDELHCGVLAKLAPDNLLCANEETYAHWEDAGVNGVDKQEESASKAGQVLAWRMKGLLKKS